MKLPAPIAALAATAAIALLPSSAFAQRQQPSPEQRIDRLERQMNQVQRQVFPRGRPADTAGVAEEPAATQSSVVSLDQRLDALERQMTDLVRQSEENGHRLQTLQAGINQLRTDQEQRISTLEQRMNDAAAAAAATTPAPTTTAPAETVPGGTKPSTKPTTTKPGTKPSTKPPVGTTASASDMPATGAAASDPGEEAYTEGFRLWEAGQYDQAISSLRAFISAYPAHRRVSYANNLVGRALLDKGQPRAAAEALLANYRNNPSGERAPDSLFYLGQALIQLGQRTQACKAYGELEAVYPKMRTDLKKQVQDAEAKAQCS